MTYISTEQEKGIEQLMKQCLRQNFADLYDDRHIVSARVLDSFVYVGYRTRNGVPMGSTHFEINVRDSTCFLLYIELEKKKEARGMDRNCLRLSKILRESMDVKKYSWHLLE